MASIDLSRGIPNIRPTRVMPKPFTRPRIEVGAASYLPQRTWGWVSPLFLVPGDVIAERGVVLAWEEITEAPPFESGLNAFEIAERVYWRVQLWAGLPDTRRYDLDPTQPVWAFAQWNIP